MAEQRALWQGELAAEPAARLVFVDESGANTKMTRLGGRTLVGERPATRIPLGHYQTGTPIAAVRLNGACAPWLFEGPMGGEMFLAWVWQGLVPALQPGDLLIVDYLATHKVAGVREAITSAGLLQASARALDAASPADSQGLSYTPITLYDLCNFSKWKPKFSTAGSPRRRAASPHQPNRFGSLYNKCHIDRGLPVFYSCHNQKRHLSRLRVSCGIVWAMN